MSSFVELKASRAQKKNTASVTRKKSSQSTPSQPENAPINSSSTSSAESHEDSQIALDQPHQHANIVEQPQSDSLPSQGHHIASLPTDLEVRLDGIRGRGIWNHKMRRKGDTILAEIPPIATLSTRYLATHCSACFTESLGQPLKRCPTCRTIYYCGSECQTRDWPLHKRECPALQRWATTSPQELPQAEDQKERELVVASDAIRALGRIVWKRQMKGGENVWVKEMDAMQSHRSSISKNENTAQLHTHMAHALIRYLGVESVDELDAFGINSITALVNLISRFTTNAFTLTSPSLTPIGICISPRIALFNHSCDPNAFLVFSRGHHRSKKEEPMAEVIAMRDIAPAQEIVISYIDSTLPRNQRQEALEETYHFTCICPLCDQQREVFVDPREGMYCPKRCSGICWLPTPENPLTRCTKCGAAVKDTDDVLDALRIGQEALDKATRVQFSDPSKAIQLTTNIISILTSTGLLPSSHPLLALSRLDTLLLITGFRSPFDSNATELISPQIQEQQKIGETNTTLDAAQEHLDETIRSATRTCNALNQVLPYGHPIRGLAVAELGKLLSVDEPRPKHLVESPHLPTSQATGSSSTFTSSSSGFGRPAPYPPSGPHRLKIAYETLVRARAELMVGFGGRNEGGAVGAEVRKLLVDVEKELGIWKDGIHSAMSDLPKENGPGK